MSKARETAVASASSRNDPRFEILFRRVSVPLLQLDSVGNCVTFNDAAAALLGGDAVELKGEAWLEFCEAGDRDHLRSLLAQPKAGETAVQTTLRSRRDAHSSLRFRANILRDSSGAPLGFVAVLELVEPSNPMEKQSESSQWEEKLRARTEKLLESNDTLRREIEGKKLVEEALRKSEERFEMISRASNDAIWDWNLVTDELWWSEGLKRVFGYDAEEIEPGAEFWGHQVHPEDRERVSQGLKAAIEQRRASWTDEYRFLRKDGAYAFISDRGLILYDDAGNPSRMIGALMDVSERHRAEEQVRQLNVELERRVEERTEQLQAANKELETFSYSVSHDLRAPLRAIEGFSRILNDDYSNKLDDDAKHYLNVIVSSCGQMTALIEDLLSLSRLGRQELRWTSLRMDDLVPAVATEVTRNWERKPEWRFDSLPEAFGDPTLVRQIWMNLLSNAVKFSSKSASPLIVVSAEADRDRVVYRIKDNGTGFDMKFAGKLFGVFQRLHGRTEFEGHGVGLAIVQRLVRRHGGNVWAEAKLGQGATFFFSLPRKAPR
jgi:PAS domain S-box-containing protein